jgi:hypothetical protein
MIRKQLTRHTAFERKMELLKNERINTRLWHLPEHKGLYPAEQSTKDIVLLSLDDLLSIQELQHGEAQRKAAVAFPVKKEYRIIGWFTRMWKEVILQPSVHIRDVTDAFADMHAISCGKDRFYNDSCEMEEEDYYDICADLSECQRYVDREWKRIKQKKERGG